MVGVACVVCWPWVRLGEDEGWPAMVAPLQHRFGACQAIGVALGIATHSMVVGKGIVLALFQALKRRCLRRFCRPPYRCSDAVQGPSDTGEGCLFKRASGAIQGSPQPPFRHHSSTIGGTNCSTVQALIAAPFRRHLQHCSQRHFRRHARRTPCVIQAPLFRCHFQAIQTMCRRYSSGISDADEKRRFWALQAFVQGSFSHHSGTVLAPLIPTVIAPF